MQSSSFLLAPCPRADWRRQGLGVRSAGGGASAVGDGLTGNHVGSQSDMVSTAQRLLYAGAASLMRGPSGVVLEGLGWAVRPNHFAPV